MRIGVRELRQNASEYLRRVEAGETIEVTQRGRPVARLVPLQRARKEQLIADGRLRPGRGDLLKRKPVAPQAGVPLPSEILERMREHER